MMGMRWSRDGRTLLRDTAAAAALFVTLFGSTLVYRYGLGAPTWADGLYRTVSVIGTGGELQADTQGPWEKGFVSVLKVAGAALLAAFPQHQQTITELTR